MCTIDTKLFEQLHKDYYYSQDDKTKLNIRNAILLQLIPVLESVANKFNNISEATREDIFQDMIERTLKTFIIKWKPTSKSIVGYYKKCCFRAAVTYIDKRKLWSDRIINIDSESYFWETKGEDDEINLLKSDFKFSSSEKQEVYQLILSLMSDGNLNRARDAYVEELSKQYDFTKAELKRLHNHALITCRDYYLDKASSKEQNINEETMFGRMSMFLRKDQIADIIKVFGGIKIKIPEWED